MFKPQSLFSISHKRHSTKLSKYCTTSGIWKAVSYNPTSNRCNLCIRERHCMNFLHAVFASLNKRNELISWCRHAGKNSLKNFGHWYFFSYLLMSCHNHSHFQRWRIYCKWPCAQFKSACHVHLHLAILSDECNTSCVKCQAKSTVD